MQSYRVPSERTNIVMGVNGANVGSSTIFKTMAKLRLKLERTKAPIEMLLVDHIEKSPTEN